MVEITPELVAILAYTGLALFLSLYFVPFKVVPRAWAKAVRTKGHAAQIALDQVLDQAVAKIQFPKVPTFTPEQLKALEDVPKLVTGYNAMVPLINNLRAENLQTLIDTAISNHEKARNAREGRAGNEGDAARVRQASENPDGLNLLQLAIRALNAMANNKVISKATAKDYTQQLKDEFASTGDITNLASSFGVNLSGLTGGVGVPSARLVPKGGGFNPG